MLDTQRCGVWKQYCIHGHELESSDAGEVSENKGRRQDDVTGIPSLDGQVEPCDL